MTYGKLIGLPGTPKSDGKTAVNPASITRRANASTSGVMPGISSMTMTAGPLPARYTVRVKPPYAIADSLNPSSAPVTVGHPPSG